MLLNKGFFFSKEKLKPFNNVILNSSLFFTVIYKSTPGLTYARIVQYLISLILPFEK